MGNIEPDISIINNIRGYRLGTRFHTATGGVYQYGKLDFGIVGKDNGKTIRDIRYQWFPKNALGAQQQIGFIY